MDMEGNRNQNMPSVTLCRAGCGFYGNQAFDGMCSKCYKDALKRKQNEPVSASDRPAADIPTTTSSATQVGGASQSTPDTSSQLTTPSVETATPTVPVATPPQQQQDDQNMSASGSDAKCEESAPGGALSAESGESPEDKKPKKNRCSTCKKKLGLTGFECRCGGLYCSLHRYSDKHDCQFDYREMAAEQIRRNNPVVVGAKIQKL